jgi:hypothetical protein
MLNQSLHFCHTYVHLEEAIKSSGIRKLTPINIVVMSLQGLNFHSLVTSKLQFEKTLKVHRKEQRQIFCGPLFRKTDRLTLTQIAPLKRNPTTVA